MPHQLVRVHWLVTAFTPRWAYVLGGIGPKDRWRRNVLATATVNTQVALMVTTVESVRDEAPYNFIVQTIHGEPIRLSRYRNQVLLIVNVASRCGFTPQYAGLEALYRKYRDRGLAVLGFPCNQFASQEPGTNEEIQAFCSARYDVTFPVFAKIEVNGEHAHEMYRWLKAQAPGLLGTEAIKWNFTKFLIDRNGLVVDRFGPSVAPADIEPRVVALLKGSNAKGQDSA